MVEVEFKAVVLIVLPNAVVPFNMNRLLWLVCCCAQLSEEYFLLLNAYDFVCGSSIGIRVVRSTGSFVFLSPDVSSALIFGLSLMLMAAAVSPPTLVSVMALLFSFDYSDFSFCSLFPTVCGELLASGFLL
ncbi:hypothetical protein L2P00_02955 [Bifidobacterium polysaccharolyticum]|nr:hypothetical protein [Bifidobacterium polysaccharolyticum]